MHEDEVKPENPEIEPSAVAPEATVTGAASPPKPAPPAPVEDNDLDDEDDLDEDAGGITDAEMEAMLESSFEVPREGEVIQGAILSITNDDVMVSVGGKSEAVIPLSEFRGETSGQTLAVGQVYDLMVKGSRGGSPILSRIDARRVMGEHRIKDAYTNGTPILAKAIRRTKGGLKVEAEGVQGFMPFSHSGVRRGHEADIEALVGQVFPAIIVEPPSGKNMVVSRRMCLEKESEKNRQSALEHLQVGQTITGKVKHLTHFGAFVDLGGIDGLLHIKDMAWGHIAKPEDVVQLGQEVEALILSIEGEKIALGIKQKSEDPWDTFESSFPVGTQCEGAVTSLTPYGAFVMLDAGVEGLIHISELSWTRRVRHPSEVLKEGERVKVVVLAYDKDKRRVSLGFKQTTEDPWARILRDSPEGSTVSGTVVSLTNFGAFVSLGDGVDGMVHVSDLSWNKKVNHPSEVLKEGDVVEAKILKIDQENRKISLGMKQVVPDPWSVAKSKYHEGDVLNVTITNLMDFGAFAQIEPGIEGLIHVSEISDKRITKPSDVLTKGQTLKASIKSIDWDKRKVGLSVKDAEREPEPEIRPAKETSHPKAEAHAPAEEVSEPLSDFGMLLNSALEKKRGKGGKDV